MSPSILQRLMTRVMFSRILRETLLVLLLALGAFVLSSTLDLSDVLVAWLARHGLPRIGNLLIGLVVACAALTLISLLRRHDLAREIRAHRRMEGALQVRAEQLEALRRVGLECTTQRDPDALLRFIIARAVELVGGDWGGMYVYHPESDDIVWEVAVGPRSTSLGARLRRGEGMSGRIWQTGRPQAVGDYDAWEGKAFSGTDFPSVVGAPVTWGGSFLGVLNVVSRRKHSFGESDADLLSMFATQAAVAIESARLLAETQRQSEQMVRLLSVSETLHSGLDLDQVLHQIACGAIQLGFRRAVINVREPDDRLVVRAIVGIEGDERERLVTADYAWADMQRLMQERFRVSHSYLVRQGEVDWERDFGKPVVLPRIAESGPGRWRPEDALLVPLMGTHGKIVGILSVDEPADGRVPDVTTVRMLETFASHAGMAIENARLYESVRDELIKRQRLEEQLLQSQKMEAVGQLAGGVAHDFNNLLTVITGYSDFIQRRPDLPTELREDIDEVRRAGERASDLTRQLLAFGRRQVQELRVLRLNDVLHEMARMLRRLIGENIALSLSLEEELVPIRADRSHIEQVVVNLVVNARDAMPAGGQLTVRTSAARLDAVAAGRIGVAAGGYALLTIRDTGVGMPPDILAHIFEPFFSTKGLGKGTGLGLATVYGIVKQSGGEIQVHSAPGEGTEFRIYLPCCEEEQSAVTAPAADALPLHRGDEAILVVEDEAPVRHFACSVLRRLGYTVLEAPDGLAALEEVTGAERPIDLVVTDVVMPRMGGRDLAARLRATRPDVRVLLMSGYPGDVTPRFDAAVADWVLKPFTAQVLADRVRQALDGPRS